MKSPKIVRRQFRGEVAPDSTVDPQMQLIAHLMLVDNIPLSAQARAGKIGSQALRNWLKGKTKKPCRVAVENVLRFHGYHMPIVHIASGETMRQPNKPVWETVGWRDRDRAIKRRRQ